MPRVGVWGSDSGSARRLGSLRGRVQRLGGEGGGGVQLVEGWASLAERVGPTLVIPVASAVVITVLWALTGWGWFDLGPWPWLFGSLPIALLGLARLGAALRVHQRTSLALGELGSAFEALSRRLGPADQGPVLAALWLARARFGRDGLRDLADALDTEDLQRVRASEDPLATALDLCAQAEPDSADPVGPVWAALSAVEVSAVTGLSSSIPSLPLTTLFLATLPVGLVTTTGWWTAVAMAGISLAFLVPEVVTESLHRPLLGAHAAPADAILAITERSLERRRGRT